MHIIVYICNDNSYKLNGDDYELNVYSIISSLIQKTHLNKNIIHYELYDSRLVKPIDFLPKDSEESFIIQYEPLADQTRIVFYRLKNEILTLTLKDFMELINASKDPRMSNMFSTNEIVKISIEAMKVLRFDRFPDIWGNHLSRVSNNFTLKVEKERFYREPDEETFEDHFSKTLILPLNQRKGNIEEETLPIQKDQSCMHLRDQFISNERLEGGIPSFMTYDQQRQNNVIKSLYNSSKSQNSVDNYKSFNVLLNKGKGIGQWRLGDSMKLLEEEISSVLKIGTEGTENNIVNVKTSTEESYEVFDQLGKRPKYNVDFEKDFESLLGRKKTHILPAV